MSITFNIGNPKADGTKQMPFGARNIEIDEEMRNATMKDIVDAIASALSIENGEIKLTAIEFTYKKIIKEKE